MGEYANERIDAVIYDGAKMIDLPEDWVSLAMACLDQATMDVETQKRIRRICNDWLEAAMTDEQRPLPPTCRYCGKPMKLLDDHMGECPERKKPLSVEEVARLSGWLDHWATLDELTFKRKDIRQILEDWKRLNTLNEAKDELLKRTCGDLERMRAALEGLLEYVDANVDRLKYKGVEMVDDRIHLARRALGKEA
jgi:hypothetical protein